MALIKVGTWHLDLSGQVEDVVRHVHYGRRTLDEFTPERVHLVVNCCIFGHAQSRLDGEWEEEWLELTVDEGYETHGLLLGGGFHYLGSDGSRCRRDADIIDGEVLHEGGVITGVVIIRCDR